MAYAYKEGRVVRFIKPITLGAIMIQTVHRSKHIVRSVQLSMALLFACNVSANNELLKLSDSSLMTPSRLGAIALFHGEKGFHVEKDNKHHEVKRYWVDPLLRGAKTKQLKAFLDNGYVFLDQMSDGEYTIKAKVRGLGGGPLLGSLFYALTKTACYGTAVAATGAVVVGTGGLAGAATGVLAAGTTLGAGSAVTMTAAAIAGAGGTAAAAEVTGAVILASGGFAGAVAAIEATSVVAYGLGTLVWFLP